MGQRALFQVSGVITLDEGKHAGEIAVMPRDMRDGRIGWFPHRIPLSHLDDVELAPAGAGHTALSERRYATGGG